MTAAYFTLLAACFLSPAGVEEGAGPALIFCCAAENDLYRVMTAGGTSYRRFDSPAEAVDKAPAGAGVLILADGYPRKTTAMAPEIFAQAAEKGLRLFVEFPSALPGMEVGSPRRVGLERAVVASDAFGPELPRLRIVGIHDCHFVATDASEPHLVAARVAGFDTAVFGLDNVKAHPLLFEHPELPLLVSTTKLSQFVTARYTPQDAMQAVWTMVLEWLRPGTKAPELAWTPAVRPTYARDEPLPPDAARQAIVRGIDWHSSARMLVHESWAEKYHEYRRRGIVNPRDPIGPAPDLAWPAGDGRHGVLEGFSSRIHYDGSQPARWWLRSDSNGESALAFALRAELDGHEPSRRVAANLLDWLYFHSGLYHNDPARADFGLIRWAPDSGSLYADNDIKIILSCMGTAALLETDRWDEVLLQNIVANYRTTGVFGFRNTLNDAAVRRDGWQHYWRARTITYAPHYQAWIWSAYLWLYDKTGYEPLLERTRDAIRMMMQAYPDRWRWTNGIQQERGRMLLTLAWLVRVDDRPEHRAWLQQMADDMERSQVACGAIREELGALAMGRYRPPQSNAEYGRNEASLIQECGDPVADLLYTCNFTFLGLHEAHAATGEPQYRRMADRLAEFVIRIQVRSEAHPNLDGGWFRAFDYDRWDYWGSNADHGWGAWAIEVGWTQGWVPTVLGLRELDLSLWDLTKDSRIARHWEETRALMLPEDAVRRPEPKRVEHAALEKPVTLASAPDPRYPGRGAASLVDGRLGAAEHTSPEWLGFHGIDLEATIDLGEPIDIQTLGANFLQSPRVGVLLPKRVEFALSADGERFEVAAVVEPEAAPEQDDPRIVVLQAKKLDARGRYVRVRAANVGVLPAGYSAAGWPAWLFVDEIMIHPN